MKRTEWGRPVGRMDHRHRVACFSIKWIHLELRFVIFYNALLWQFTTITGVYVE